MPNHFYKAVLDMHILGKSLIKPEIGPGIRYEGLDPKKRNASGGATVVAAAQSGRPLSAADGTSFGQCLTGHRDIAERYKTSREHRLLRISLPDSMISAIVRNAASYDEYANMQAALKDRECTAIAKIPPEYIEFLNHLGIWIPINAYPDRSPSYSDSESDSESDFGDDF